MVTVELGTDQQPHRVAADSLAAVPPNVVHAFVNDSDAEARFLNFHAPDDGLADFLRGISD